eukprot:371928-Rhodomonas_salina.4
MSSLNFSADCACAGREEIGEKSADEGGRRGAKVGEKTGGGRWELRKVEGGHGILFGHVGVILRELRDAAREVGCAVCLRACYAMPGTDAAYRAMPGTDTVYRAAVLTRTDTAYGTSCACYAMHGMVQNASDKAYFNAGR